MLISPADRKSPLMNRSIELYNNTEIQHAFGHHYLRSLPAFFFWLITTLQRKAILYEGINLQADSKAVHLHGLCDAKSDGWPRIMDRIVNLQ